MNHAPSSASNSMQSRLAWFGVLLLMVASATHLLRSALKSDQNIAILMAFAVFGLFIVLKLGRQSTSVLGRRYLPWSILPIIILAIWAANARLFGKFDVSAVLFHLDHSLAYDGVGDDIVEFAAYLLFGGLLMACISFLSRRDRRVAILERVAAVLLLLFNPITSYAYDTLLNPNRNGLDLSEVYQPVEVEPSAPTPKNLILIYLESMEATYAKPSFGDVYADLDALSTQGLRINGVTQIQDTAWTIAGLVASQCGIPLLSYGLIMKNRMKNIETFLPNADCLASQLSAQGYQTRFYGGASLRFAGKGKFLTTHGYQTAVGLDEIDEANRGPVGEWGIYDDRLFDLALGELAELSRQDAPYLLSILTLGAHFPNGYPAPSCLQKRQDDAVTDSTLFSVKCTAQLTRDFLTRAEAEGYLDNTVVVLLSDHLSQKNVHTPTLNQYERENLVLLMGAGISPGDITKPGSMMDVYPTLLESLGLPASQGLAGLGVSLLGDSPTVLETYGEDTLNLAIRSDKALRKRLWDLEPATDTDTQ